MKIFLLPLIAITLSIILLTSSLFHKAVGIFGIIVGILYFIDLVYLYKEKEKDRW